MLPYFFTTPKLTLLLVVLSFWSHALCTHFPNKRIQLLLFKLMITTPQNTPTKNKQTNNPQNQDRENKAQLNPSLLKTNKNSTLRKSIPDKMIRAATQSSPNTYSNSSSRKMRLKLISEQKPPSSNSKSVRNSNKDSKLQKVHNPSSRFYRVDNPSSSQQAKSVIIPPQNIYNPSSKLLQSGTNHQAQSAQPKFYKVDNPSSTQQATSVTIPPKNKLNVQNIYNPSSNLQ